MAYNLIGFKNYELIVIAKHNQKDTRGKTLWLCKCSCGKEKLFTTNDLTSSKKAAKSCHNCNWHIEHKDAYVSWMAMKARCDDSTRKDYKYYGALGIKYQLSWGIFVRFYEDMGDPPIDTVTGERMSLERKNTLLGYSKDNCTWATRSEQQLNKRDKYVHGVDDLELV
jgi:hypothetical protein